MLFITCVLLQQLDPGAAVARGSPMLVRMFVLLWLVNATNLPIGAVVVATQPHGGQGGQRGGRKHTWRHADCSQEQHPQSHGDKAQAIVSYSLNYFRILCGLHAAL